MLPCSRRYVKGRRKVDCNFSDEQLIEKFKAGEALAFEVIYDKYKNMIKSCARKFFLVGGDNEDLMQEGVVGLLNAVNTFNGKSGFSTYAHRIEDTLFYIQGIEITSVNVVGSEDAEDVLTVLGSARHCEKQQEKYSFHVLVILALNVFPSCLKPGNGGMQIEPE